MRKPISRLASCLPRGPVMVGPVELGHLSYQPGKAGPMGADHCLLVLAGEDGYATVHDPQGYPYARLPLADFTAAYLHRVGHRAAAAVAAGQARLVGSLQHPLVIGDDATAATVLRTLAPTYDELRVTLEREVGS